jgi:hypothetical protein
MACVMRLTVLQDDSYIIFIFGPHAWPWSFYVPSKFTDNVNPLVEKDFRLTLNFTRRSTYNTRAVYRLCHETYRMIAILFSFLAPMVILRT